MIDILAIDPEVIVVDRDGQEVKVDKELFERFVDIHDRRSFLGSCVTDGQLIEKSGVIEWEQYYENEKNLISDLGDYLKVQDLKKIKGKDFGKSLQAMFKSIKEAS